MFYRKTGAGTGPGSENRQAMKALVDRGTVPGLIGYEDGVPRGAPGIDIGNLSGEAAVEGVEVRAATAADQDGIHALAAAYGNLGHWPQRPDYLDHELATGILMVATRDGAVAGFAGLLE